MRGPTCRTSPPCRAVLYPSRVRAPRLHVAVSSPGCTPVVVVDGTGPALHHTHTLDSSKPRPKQPRFGRRLATRSACCARLPRPPLPTTPDPIISGHGGKAACGLTSSTALCAWAVRLPLRSLPVGRASRRLGRPPWLPRLRAAPCTPPSLPCRARPSALRPSPHGLDGLAVEPHALSRHLFCGRSAIRSPCRRCLFSRALRAPDDSDPAASPRRCWLCGSPLPGNAVDDVAGARYLL